MIPQFQRWAFVYSFNAQSAYEAEYRIADSATWTQAFFSFGNDSEICFLTKPTRGTCYYLRVRGICKFNCGFYHTSSWVTMVINTGAASRPNPPPTPPNPPVPPCPPDPPTPPSPTPFVCTNFSFTIDPCMPGRVCFSNSSIASGTLIRSVEWDLGDNTISTANNPLHTYQKSGSYDVVLTVIDDFGKIYTKKATVAVPTLTTRFANAGSDQMFCTQNAVALHASSGETYSWSPSIGLSNCNIPDPTLSIVTSMNYIVTVTDKNGCIDRDTVLVKFIDPASKIYIPNAFTLNNDGVNDQFIPLIPLQGQFNAEWKLFNRFGNMIFSTNNSTTGWDGKYKGELQLPGNYSYFVTIKATGTCPAKNFKGTVLLIR
jgi:gliding motility-associated-like protein